MTDEMTHCRERRNVAITMIVSTLAAAVVLAAVVLTVSAVGRERLRRIDKAIERGDFTAAQTMIAALSDENIRGEYEKKETYARAAGALSAGDWQTALGLFTALGNYADAPDLAKEAGYRLAGRQLEDGDYEDAREGFSRLGNYMDAPDKEKEAGYRLAASHVAEGRVYEGFLLYSSLGDYADAREQALSLAEQITGVRDAEAAMAAVLGLSETERSHRDELGRLRLDVPEGILALGFYHTAGRKSDGTVLACGDNSFGQCDVDDWRDVQSICAGAYHTAALLADGTVKAVGRNEEGQCDVSAWRDIIAVTAADYATFGLRADGTVVYTGYNDYYMLDQWTGITRISGGTFALSGLRSDATALVTHESARSEELRELVDVAVTTGCAAGLRPDGTVVLTGERSPDWQDIIALSLGSSALLGLDAEGRVHARFFRAGDEVDFYDLNDVAALAAGGTHYVFVHKDGSVTALGDNSCGQCETAQWDLY